MTTKVTKVHEGKDYLIVGVGLVKIVDLRLKPGVTHEQANAALQPVLEQFARDMPKHFPDHFKQVEDLNAWVRRGISGTLYLLFGAVALLLAAGMGMLLSCCWRRRAGFSWCLWWLARCRRGLRREWIR